MITTIPERYIVWDMVTMLPSETRLFWLNGPNTKFPPEEMNTVYFAFLLAYTGYKELKK
jgi:hypothetical protein